MLYLNENCVLSVCAWWRIDKKKGFFCCTTVEQQRAHLIRACYSTKSEKCPIKSKFRNQLKLKMRSSN